MCPIYNRAKRGRYHFTPHVSATSDQPAARLRLTADPLQLYRVEASSTAHCDSLSCLAAHLILLNAAMSTTTSTVHVMRDEAYCSLELQGPQAGVPPSPATPSAAAAAAAAAAAGVSSGQHTYRALLRKAQQLCIEHFMVLSFSCALLIAMVWPTPGKAVGALQVGDIKIIQALNNIMVFLISGLTLKSDDLKALLRQWPAWLYGVAGILLITPCAGFAMVHLPLTPKEFAAGLAIFCVVPTTLGVGVALTAASRGNQALALFLTVVTNLLGIVSVPYTLRLVLANTGAVTVEPQSLVVKLLITVLVPTVAGKLLQQFVPGMQAWVNRHKTQLSMFSTTNLALIVWQTLSGAQSILVRLPLVNVVVVIAVSSALHLVFLVFNGLVCKCILRFQRREGVAVLIMASQKSAPVAVTVITYMTTDSAQQGLLALPCIIGQLAQIFIGAVLVRLLRSLKRAEEDD